MFIFQIEIGTSYCTRRATTWTKEPQNKLPMLPFIALGILLAAIFAAYYFATFALTRVASNCDPRLPRFWIPAAALFAFWLFTPFVYEFSGWPTSTPITFTTDGHIVKHPWGMFTTHLDGRFSNLPNARSSAWIKNIPSVTLLTENPKVRKIQPSIMLELTDYETFFRVDDRQRELHMSYGISVSEESLFSRKIAWIVRNEMYNFNNAHSKEMAKFFNPLNEDQQREYEALVKSDLEPVLAKDGVVVRKVLFSIE